MTLLFRRQLHCAGVAASLAPNVAQIILSVADRRRV
jgi:hypothetical protein